MHAIKFQPGPMIFLENPIFSWLGVSDGLRGIFRLPNLQITSPVPYRLEGPAILTNIWEHPMGRLVLLLTNLFSYLHHHFLAYFSSSHHICQGPWMVMMTSPGWDIHTYHWLLLGGLGVFIQRAALGKIRNDLPFCPPSQNKTKEMREKKNMKCQEFLLPIYSSLHE